MELIEYLIKTSPQAFLQLLQMFGSQLQALNAQQMLNEAQRITQQYGETFIAACYQIHPDRQILKEMEVENQPPCILKKLPEGVRKFYSGEHRNIKLIATAALLIFIIRKL